MLQPVDGPNHVNETSSFACYNLFNGKYKNDEKLTFPFHYFVSLLTPSFAHSDIGIG